jgi:hypothetical protein
MNEMPPQYDENNPEEAVRFYLQQVRTIAQSMLGDGVWKLCFIVCIVFALCLLWLLKAHLYPMNTVVILKVIAYGLVPTVLAWAGDHFAAEVIKDSATRRMYRAFFMVFAMLGVLLIALLENKSDRDHVAEVTGLSSKIDSVHLQNEAILNKLVSPGPELNTQTKEVSRRKNILALLRNEYILTHDDVSAALLTGTVS